MTKRRKEAAGVEVTTEGLLIFRGVVYKQAADPRVYDSSYHEATRRQAGYNREDFDEDYLYHVTFAKHLPSIAEKGLTPQGAVTERQFPNLDYSHSKGYVFLSEDGATPIWAEFLTFGGLMDEEPVYSGEIPVLLRIPLSSIDLDLLQEDEVGTADVPEGKAYRTTQSIPSRGMEVWAPEGHFVPLRSVNTQDYIERALEVSDAIEDVVNLFVPYW